MKGKKNNTVFFAVFGGAVFFAAAAFSAVFGAGNSLPYSGNAVLAAVGQNTPAQFIVFGILMLVSFAALMLLLGTKKKDGEKNDDGEKENLKSDGVPVRLGTVDVDGTDGKVYSEKIPDTDDIYIIDESTFTEAPQATGGVFVEEKDEKEYREIAEGTDEEIAEIIEELNASGEEEEIEEKEEVGEIIEESNEEEEITEKIDDGEVVEIIEETIEELNADGKEEEAAEENADEIIELTVDGEVSDEIIEEIAAISANAAAKKKADDGEFKDLIDAKAAAAIAKQDAERAKAEVELAKNAAEKARDEAVIAEAECAREEAEKAKAEAERAKIEAANAEREKDEAEKARLEAEMFAEEAEKAKAEAEIFAEEAEKNGTEKADGDITESQEDENGDTAGSQDDDGDTTENSDGKTVVELLAEIDALVGVIAEELETDKETIGDMVGALIEQLLQDEGIEKENLASIVTAALTEQFAGLAGGEDGNDEITDENAEIVGENENAETADGGENLVSLVAAALAAEQEDASAFDYLLGGSAADKKGDDGFLSIEKLIKAAAEEAEAEKASRVKTDKEIEEAARFLGAESLIKDADIERQKKQEKIEQAEKAKQEKIEQAEKAKQEKIENAERIKREKAEQAEILKAEKAEESEKARQEKIEQAERAKQEKIENAEKLKQEKAEQAEKAKQEKIEQIEKAKQEKIENAEKLKQEKAEQAAKAKRDRLAEAERAKIEAEEQRRAERDAAKRRMEEKLRDEAGKLLKARPDGYNPYVRKEILYNKDSDEVTIVTMGEYRPSEFTDRDENGELILKNAVEE
jgi:membrane protein implicated in regulation of membrane protease activity